MIRTAMLSLLVLIPWGAMVAESVAQLPRGPQAATSVRRPIDRYVTRFQVQRDLAYQRVTEWVPVRRVKKSWNPFSSSQSIEVVSVPVVKWVPRWKEGVLPITERQLVGSLAASETPPTSRPAASPDHTLEMAQLRPPEWHPQRPAVSSGLGGIQRFDDDYPRQPSKVLR